MNARDRQVAVETVRPASTCTHCSPGMTHKGQTVCDPSGMSNGPTPRRAVRVDEETWAAATNRAELEHRTVSDVVRIALRAYAEGTYDALPTAVRRPS